MNDSNPAKNKTGDGGKTNPLTPLAHRNRERIWIKQLASVGDWTCNRVSYEEKSAANKMSIRTSGRDWEWTEQHSSKTGKWSNRPSANLLQEKSDLSQANKEQSRPGRPTARWTADRVSNQKSESSTVKSESKNWRNFRSSGGNRN
jgi:hypothetical protein